MRSVVLLLLGVHLVNAGMHSHMVIYTATKGVPDFPEFVAATMVDGTQVNYYDSEIKEVIPRQDWVRGAVDEQFWQRNTQIRSTVHQTFKNNINIVMERFNQTQGVHTFQEMYGCEWDDETGVTNGFNQYGYDGEDLISLDLKELRYISPVQQGIPSVQKWNNERARLDYLKTYFSTECTKWLQKYVDYGKSNLEKKVSPQVSLLQKDSSSPVTCHATGFYPKEVTITWMKNGQDHHEDVDLGELLPNADGTFQKSSTISVTSDEWKKNKYSCVVEHQGKTKTVDEIWKIGGESVSIGIIVGALAAVVLLILTGVAGYVVYKKKQGFKPVSGSDDGSNSSAQAVPRA